MTDSLMMKTVASCGYGCARYRVIVLFLALSLVAALLNSSAPTPLYPVFQRELGLTSFKMTVIYGAYAAGVLFALLMAGRLLSRFSDLRLMIFPALLMIFLGALFFTLGNSFMIFVVARVFAGVGTGVLTSAANVALLRYCPADGGKSAALMATLSFTTGLALGPVLSGIGLQFGWLPASLSFVFIMTLALTALAGLWYVWPVKSTRTLGVVRVGSHGAQSVRQEIIAAGGGFYICAGSLFICWAFAASILSVGPAVSEQLLGIKSHSIYGYVVAVYLLIAGISQIASRRVSARDSLFAGSLVQVVSIALFALAVTVNSVLISCFALILAGYAYGAIFVGSATLINFIAPSGRQGYVLTLFYVIAYTANWVPVIAGRAIDLFGLVTSIDILFVSTSVGSLILAVYVIKHKWKGTGNDAT